MIGGQPRLYAAITDVSRFLELVRPTTSCKEKWERIREHLAPLSDYRPFALALARAKTLAILHRANEGLHHLGINEVAVKGI